MIQIIGAYRIFPTNESIIISARFHNFRWRFNKQGDYIYSKNLTNFENLYLIEIQVIGDYSPDILMRTEHNNQAPYLEYYLDSTGTQLMDESEAIKIDGRRVCFFLHFCDPHQPVKFGNQSFDLPKGMDLPERLKPYTHYVPVD